jgi:putative redox protein
MSIQVTFPQGVQVAASYKGHTVLTDQPLSAGGTDAAPSPFDLFLLSIATCAGFYALRFCQEREIDTEGLAVELSPMRGEGSKKIETLRIDVRTPEGFPEKYVEAIKRAVDQCAVKRHIIEPPAFEVVVATPALV